jgi:hypothetical protein
MSLAEIKSELRNLTAEERKEVARALLELDGEAQGPERKAASFAEAKAYVFDHYGDLLRRLAQ